MHTISTPDDNYHYFYEYTHRSDGHIDHLASCPAQGADPDIHVTLSHHQTASPTRKGEYQHSEMCNGFHPKLQALDTSVEQSVCLIQPIS